VGDPASPVTGRALNAYVAASAGGIEIEAHRPFAAPAMLDAAFHSLAPITW